MRARRGRGGGGVGQRRGRTRASHMPRHAERRNVVPCSEGRCAVDRSRARPNSKSAAQRLAATSRRLGRLCTVTASPDAPTSAGATLSTAGAGAEERAERSRRTQLGGQARPQWAREEKHDGATGVEAVGAARRPQWKTTKTSAALVEEAGATARSSSSRSNLEAGRGGQRTKRSCRRRRGRPRCRGRRPTPLARAAAALSRAPAYPHPPCRPRSAPLVRGDAHRC